MDIAIIVSGWVACGFVAYGGLLASLLSDFGEADKRAHMGFAFAFSLIFGPFALAIAAMLTGLFADGWRLR